MLSMYYIYKVVLCNTHYNSTHNWGRYKVKSYNFSVIPPNSSALKKYHKSYQTQCVPTEIICWITRPYFIASHLPRVSNAHVAACTKPQMHLDASVCRAYASAGGKGKWRRGDDRRTRSPDKWSENLQLPIRRCIKSVRTGGSSVLKAHLVSTIRFAVHVFL